MKKCKFCKQPTPHQGLKKRTVTLPTGLEITSLDPMCKLCYNKLNEQYGKSNNISRDTHFEQIEGVSIPTPDTKG